MEEVFKDSSLESTRTARYTRSLAVTSSSYFLLPVTAPTPSTFGGDPKEAALRALAAACFWPFSPEWLKRPK